MALKRQTGSIPEGAVLLSEEEAVHHQWKIISSWEPKSDGWPFRYALGISALSSALTASYINNHFRKMLRLAHHGRALSFLPNVIIPALASSMFHQNIMTDIMIMKGECPACIQIRSSIYQALFGSIYPTMLAPISTMMMATRFYTFPVPPIQTMPAEVVKLWIKMTKPLHSFLVAAAIGHALIGSSLAYLEMKSIINISQKMASIENQ